MPLSGLRKKHSTGYGVEAKLLRHSRYLNHTVYEMSNSYKRLSSTAFQKVN